MIPSLVSLYYLLTTFRAVLYVCSDFVECSIVHTASAPVYCVIVLSKHYQLPVSYRSGNLTQAAAFLVTKVQTCSWQGDFLSGIESPTLP